MEFLVNFAKVFVGYVGVDLGGCNIGVAEEALDGTNINSGAKHIGCETMADRMGRNFFDDSRPFTRFPHDSFYLPRCQPKVRRLTFVVCRDFI